MPANLINKTDTNKQTFPKINQAIIDSFEAINKATKADQNSNTALSRMKSVQSQLNQLVIEGDSSVEAAQMRVDAEGNEHATAKERVDSDFNKLNSKIVNTEENLKNDYKNFYINQAHEIYLYDLQLAGSTVNQGLVIDEEYQEIYTTQVHNPNNDPTEGFIISRLTIGGKLLDSMYVRYGGHGTSFHIERINGKIYIYSNVVRADVSGKLVTQYFARYPYNPGTEITADSAGVERLIEFPDSKKYMTPFGDVKNGLIAFRHTNNGATRIELRRLEDVKLGIENILYTYYFDDSMNAEALQGLTLDGTTVYFTLGQYADQFHLYQVDMKTGEVTGEIKRPFGKNQNGGYEEGFGEPEGLYLYTDPETNHKTLFTIVVTDATGRRRYKLFAISWNAGVQKFIGLAQERTQSIKLTRDDGKAKRIPSGLPNIGSIKEVGWYYLTSAEGDLPDNPFRGRGGIFLNVSPYGSSPWFIQEATLASSVSPERAWRLVDGPNGTSSWIKVTGTVM